MHTLMLLLYQALQPYKPLQQDPDSLTPMQQIDIHTLSEGIQSFSIQFPLYIDALTMM